MLGSHEHLSLVIKRQMPLPTLLLSLPSVALFSIPILIMYDELVTRLGFSRHMTSTCTSFILWRTTIDYALSTFNSADMIEWEEIQCCEHPRLFMQPVNSTLQRKVPRLFESLEAEARLLCTAYEELHPQCKKYESAPV